MPNVINSISVSSTHSSRTENHENRDSVGNEELSPLATALDCVRNSTHELHKGCLPGKTSEYLNQAWQWLRTTSHGQSSGENGCNEEGIELQEILTEGENLRWQADSLRAGETDETVPRGWKGSILKRCLVGVGLMGAAGCTGYKYYNAGGASSGSQKNTLQPSYTPPDAINPGENLYRNLEDSFGHHSLHHDDPTNRKRHARRHVNLQTPPATFDRVRSPVSVKNDYLCFEERENISSSDMLRIISKTLKLPFTKSAEEWQVFYKAYVLGEGCPNKAYLHYYEDIFFGFDYLVQNLISLFPQILPVRIAQNLISPILDMIADELDGREMNLEVVEQINLEILGLTQMIVSSLDLAAKESLFDRDDDQKKLNEIFELDKGHASIKFQGSNVKYRLGLDSKGTYIHQMDKGNLEYERKYVEYNGLSKKWEATEQPKVIDLAYPLVGEEPIDLKKHLLNQVRVAARKKFISARSFVGDVLTNSGTLSKELFNKAIESELEALPRSDYLESIKEVDNLSQLKNIKAGHILLFLSGGGRLGEEQVQHTMVSLGDGIFAGAENTILSTSNEYSGIILAEQLGRFNDNIPGDFVTNENKIFHLISGALKGSRVSQYTDYKEAALNLSPHSLKKPGRGIGAIAEILSEMGDISVTFSNYLNEELLRKNPILPKALEIGQEIEPKDIIKKLPIGKVICLMSSFDINFNGAIFALRLNEEEIFIPAISEPLLRNAARGSIFKIDEILTHFLTYQIKQVAFSPENLRVPMLLGKDSSFFVKDSVLHVRAHGFPGLVNFMNAGEIVNIIKSLSISKNIDLKLIKAIDLESCYGANNFPLIPSTGKAISKIIGKPVIAYKGKYRAGIKNEDQKRQVFSEDSHLHDLESFVMQYAADRSFQTVTAIRNMYDYLVNSDAPHSSKIEKRSIEDFNAYLLDVGGLILGKIPSLTFLNKYQDLYGINRKTMSLIKSEILSPLPGGKEDFVDEFLEILSLDDTAFARLFSLFVGSGNEDTIVYPNKLWTAPDYIQDNRKDHHELIYKNIGGILGLSGGNKFFLPRNKSEFGEPGDVYYDDRSNKYFVLKKEGIPQNHGWRFPSDGMNNDVWIYAGVHPGSLIRPKGWSEYGKAGSIYFGRKEGYFVLRKEGRPSEPRWYYPSNGTPNEFFYPLNLDIGDFRKPLSPEKTGDKGSVYLFGKDYFILKNAIKSRPYGSTYPIKREDNDHWIYAGVHEGSIQDPKKWDEYGKPGCIYHHEDLGYYMLKVEGRPSDNNWNLPDSQISDNLWQFISTQIGTVESPKLFDVEGLAGEVYYDLSTKAYYILRRDGKPSSNNWEYPKKVENKHWLYMDINKPYFYNDLV